jgi:hypothetical protein
MPEPTSAKWEVPVTCARLFLLGIEVAPGREGKEATMLEEFASYVLSRMRGTVNADRPQDAGKHPHRAKWQALSAPTVVARRSTSPACISTRTCGGSLAPAMNSA